MILLASSSTQRYWQDHTWPAAAAWWAGWDSGFRSLEPTCQVRPLRSKAFPCTAEHMNRQASLGFGIQGPKRIVLHQGCRRTEAKACAIRPTAVDQIYCLVLPRCFKCPGRFLPFHTYVVKRLLHLLRRCLASCPNEVSTKPTTALTWSSVSPRTSAATSQAVSHRSTTSASAYSGESF